LHILFHFINNMVHKETCFAKLKVEIGILQKVQTSVQMINTFQINHSPISLAFY
jgi:hypothetical protein